MARLFVWLRRLLMSNNAKKFIQELDKILENKTKKEKLFILDRCIEYLELANA